MAYCTLNCFVQRTLTNTIEYTTIRYSALLVITLVSLQDKGIVHWSITQLKEYITVKHKYCILKYTSKR